MGEARNAYIIYERKYVVKRQFEGWKSHRRVAVGCLSGRTDVFGTGSG
jgi:hypothetical protein